MPPETQSTGSHRGMTGAAVAVLVIIIVAVVGYFKYERQGAQTAPVNVPSSGPTAITPQTLKTATAGKLANPLLSQFVIAKDAIILDSSIQGVANSKGASSTSSVVHFATNTSSIDMYKAYMAYLPSDGFSITSNDTRGKDLTIFSGNSSGQSVVVVVSPIDTARSKVGVFLNQPSTK